MSEPTANQISVDVSNPESLGRGLQLVDNNIVALGRAVSTLATILGMTIAVKECAHKPISLTEALFASLDAAEQIEDFSAPLIQTLRSALQTGIEASTPPHGGTRLRIVQGEKKAA